jgi:site-specific recombinase XerD
MELNVETGMCPITGNITYAIYDGECPVVPATIYLRHLEVNRELRFNTLATYAYALKHFFYFLRRNKVSFSEISVSHIKLFKRIYLGRKDKERQFLIKRYTARQYLDAVRRMMHYWRGFRDDDPMFIDQVAEMDGVRRSRFRRGVLSHVSWHERVPNDLWHIKIPVKEKHVKPRYKGLSSDECRTVMRVLDRAKHATDAQTMLYYRDRAIWTFLLMSGLRKGELCRIRLDDINQTAGVITLKDRPEDAWLGELKSGPDEIFVSSSHPLWSYLNTWLLEGRWVAEEILKRRGMRDHHMLFCTRYGGPLTQAAVNHFFQQTKTDCGFDKNVLFRPHAARHTIATLMLNSGAAKEIVQKFLRHRSSASTEIYASVADNKYREAVRRFAKTCGVLT